MIRDLDALRSHPAALAVAAALALLAAAPPDVHGDAAAGIAALVALAALATARCAPPLRAGFLALAVVVAIPLARAAEATGAAVRPLAALAFGAAAGVAAANLPERVRSLGFWSGLIAAAGTWAGLLAVYEAAFGLDAMRTAARAASGLAERELILGRIAEGRAYAGFPTPAALGAFLVIALGATAGAAVARSGRTRIAYVVAAVVQAAGLVASRSLSAAGALVVALAIFAFRARVSDGARRRLLAAGAIAVLVLGAAVALRGRGALDAGAEGSPWALRLGNVRAAVRMAADHPWIGVGPGGYGEAFPQYRTGGDNTARHAHSLPFDLVAETGVPLGAVLTVAFFAIFLIPLVRERGSGVRAGAAVGLAAFAIQNLGDFTALLPSTLAVAAIVRGLAAREESRGTTTSAAAFALASIAACGVVAADGLAMDARRAAREAFTAGDLPLALSEADTAIARAPWDPDASLYRAQILEAAGHPDALDEADRAVALVPVRPAAHAVRARLRAAHGDLGGALSDLEEAARLYPSDAAYARARDEFARRLSELRP